LDDVHHPFHIHVKDEVNLVIVKIGETDLGIHTSVSNEHGQATTLGSNIIHHANAGFLVPHVELVHIESVFARLSTPFLGHTSHRDTGAVECEYLRDSATYSSGSTGHQRGTTSKQSSHCHSSNTVDRRRHNSW